MIGSELAKKLGCTVAISGATDVVTDGKHSLLVDNGHPLMGSISGTGCMAASVIGAFCAESKDPVTASAAAFAAFGPCRGEGSGGGARAALLQGGTVR